MLLLPLAVLHRREENYNMETWKAATAHDLWPQVSIVQIFYAYSIFLHNYFSQPVFSDCYFIEGVESVLLPRCTFAQVSSAFNDYFDTLNLTRSKKVWRRWTLGLFYSASLKLFKDFKDAVIVHTTFWQGLARWVGRRLPFLFCPLWLVVTIYSNFVHVVIEGFSVFTLVWFVCLVHFLFYFSATG